MSEQTDRELLELAAKAAGVRYDGYDEDAGWDIWFVPELSRYAAWNPLTDDGDALRPAMKLGISIQPIYAGAQCGASVEQNTANPCAATRRAIVRAAAAVGSTK